MRKLVRALGAAALSAVLIVGTGCAGHESTPETNGGKTAIKLATTNIIGQSPVFLARDLGYYDDEGLDVTIVETDSGDATTQAMLGGSVDLGATGFNTPIRLTLQGQTVQSIAGLMMRSIYVFVGGNSFPQIGADDPQAFVDAVKGKKFGVAAVGSTGDTIARGLFTEYGLNPDTDVNIIAVGTGAEANAALQTGAVDAVITYDPDLTKILQSGIGRIVFDLRTTTTETKYSQLPTTTVMATKQWIDSNGDTAQAFVRAITRANNTLREDPATALPALQKLYTELPPQDVEQIYKSAQENFSSDIPESTFDAAMKIYLDSKTFDKPVAYDEVVATQFADLWTAKTPGS